MGARLINNPRRTKIGHVEAFPVLHMRSLRKSAMFSEGQRTEGHLGHPGASNAITIIVDLRSEHDLKVLLKVGHADSATNMQVIGLTHRPTGFNGRRWYFVSKNGERAETLFLVEGFFRTGKGETMGARLINNPRRTKIGHVEPFPDLHMRSLRKRAMFIEGQRTEGHFLYPGASNAITIIVDLRSEHDLKVLLKVEHADSATNMQVIGLTHRPTAFHGRRWYFVSENGERAETLFLVGGFFRTRTEAGLTYRSQSQGELDRALDRRRKLQVQLEGTGARGPARGRRREQAEEKLAEIQRLVDAFESGLVFQDQNRRAQARELRRSSFERLEADP